MLQEEEQRSILADVEANPELQDMIEQSKHEYKLGKGMSTSHPSNLLAAILSE